MTHRNINHQPGGFALLITLVTLTVVVSVTLAIVELSMKQLALSVSSTDSELAFQAANAGMECARFVRNDADFHDEFEAGLEVQFDCMADSQSRAPEDLTPSAGNGIVRVYSEIEFNWGEGVQARCSKIDMLTMIADDTGNDLEYDLVRDYIPGYPTATKTCTLGGRCTIVSVTGYSAACAEKNVEGTLKRELLLEF